MIWQLVCTSVMLFAEAGSAVIIIRGGNIVCGVRAQNGASYYPFRTFCSYTPPFQLPSRIVRPMITGDVLMMAAVNCQEGTAPSTCTCGRGNAADLTESMRTGCSCEPPRTLKSQAEDLAAYLAQPVKCRKPVNGVSGPVLHGIPFCGHTNPSRAHKFCLRSDD